MDNLHYDNINMKLLPYTLSRQKEILGLLKKGIFQVVNLKKLLVGIWVFNPQFVDKIKNTSIDKAFEKFYLVVQAYNNYNKDFILTQSPII